MQEVPVENCYKQPNLYRLCNKVLCIPWQHKCPCRSRSEFRCMEGNCLPIRLKCDGIQQCLYGEDEKLCELEQKAEQIIRSTTVSETSPKGETASPGSQTTSPGTPRNNDKGLPIPVVVSITSVSVFVFIIVIICLCLFISRKETHIQHKEAPSEPRRKDTGNRANMEDSESYICTKDVMTESLYFPMKDVQNAQKPNPSDHSDYSISNYPSKDNDGICEIEVNNTDTTDNVTTRERETSSCVNDDVSRKERKNLAINPGAEIYNTDEPNEYRFSGLGKFMFKPRLKYFNSVIEHEQDERSTEPPCVMTNCSSYSKIKSVPVNVIVYKDINRY